MAEVKKPYPLSLQIDYPEKLNRLTTFFRAFTIIPILIILGLVAGSVSKTNWMSDWGFQLSSAALVIAPLVLMLLFRKKYPRWWFDWNLALLRFGTRIEAYFYLLRDEYPSTDEEQAVHLDITYPDAQKELMRGMPLVKWLLAIPHYIVLGLLGIAVAVCLVVTWFAILFTGRFPRGLFEFVVGYMRWWLRVCAYACVLVTDCYPPFSLD